ncbi:MAG: WXG100 family type VII secretion target [Bacillota bacterium]
MGLIQVTPEELEARARLLDQKRQLHLENLNQIINSINELEAGWKGEAQLGFYQEFRNMQQPMKQFADIMERFSAFLNKAAIEFRETDQRNRTVPGA